MREIPLLDLKGQNARLKSALLREIEDVLDSGQYILGPKVESFEHNFAKYCQAEYAIGVNSGTSALQLALLAAGIGKGDEVITTPLTFVATAAAIEYVGATPIFADICSESLNIDPEKVAAKITDRTKAIIPVHLHGLMSKMDELRDLANRAGVILIEDASQAHGAELNNARAGSYGDMACFSFYPGKNLGAMGEGGAVVTSNIQYAETVRELRDWGQRGKGNHVQRGFNCRMDAIQGAVLNVKLHQLDSWTRSRGTLAARYTERFLNSKIKITPTPSNFKHAFHVYAIRVENREAMQASLQHQGVTTGVHYRVPVHLQPAYSDLGYKVGSLPISEAIAPTLLSLPIYPEMREADVDFVATHVLGLTGEEQCQAGLF